jgi:hypothetical protein
VLREGEYRWGCRSVDVQTGTIELTHDREYYLQSQIIFKLLLNLTLKLNSNLRNICKKY